LQGLAVELNKQGIPTPSGTGQWQPAQVRRWGIRCNADTISSARRTAIR
jgi:hypothetical protein